jgi:carboxyl-terminal processing protease
MMMRKALRILAAASLAALLFSAAAGSADKPAAGKGEAKKSKDDLYKQVELFADAVSILRSDYVDEIESKKLIYGAMKGMLSSLDDYSQFMEPEDYEEIKVETRGEFGGVGVEITLREGILTVVAPIADTPAEEAGIRPGDKIVRIDGSLTKNMTLSDAVKRMRGKPGTSVSLTVWREDDGSVSDAAIKRAVVKVRSITKSELIDGRTGYIKLVEFQENTPRDLDEALRKLEGQRMDSLILDLRNNPGGLLDGAVDVAERFLPKDAVIVSIKSRDPAEDAVFKSSGRFVRPEYPLAVLVNEGSASASEIVSGAIKDNRRGIVIGAKTFGKASVQTIIPLKDGSAIRFTTASYVTPSGKMIKGEGIVPDVPVARTGPESRMKEDYDIFDKIGGEKTTGMDANLAQPAKLQGAKKEADNQLEAAVNLMRAIKVYKSDKS